MSQDTGAVQNANQDINIDELEVEILIVAKNPNNLKQTCAFLSRRGWPTTAIGNISKAIEEIAEKKPDIVMISLNHPSPTIQKLPDLIAQSFNLICVGFVENNDATSTGKLQAVKLRHKINGSPSGPNFHRGIRKILAEKFDIKLDEKPEREKKQKEGPSVTVRGGGKGDDRTVVSGKKGAQGPVVISGKSAEDANGSGDSSDGPAYMPDHAKRGRADEDETSESGGPIIQHGTRGPGGTGGARARNANGGLADAGDADEFGAMDSEDGAHDSGGFGGESESGSGSKGPGGVIAFERGSKASEGGAGTNATGRRKKLKALTATETAEAAGDMLFGENVEGDKPGFHGREESVEEKAARALLEEASGGGRSGAPQGGPESTTPENVADKIKQSLFQSIEAEKESTPHGVMEKAVEKALAEVCRSNPDIPPIRLTVVKRIGVFPVDSATVPGYLVVALETGAADDQKRFLKNCEIGLKGNLEAVGVAGTLESGFWLDVPEISFEQWTQNAATFTFKLLHQGHEVGVSFFQTEKPIAKPQPSTHKEMCTIGLADISTDEPVTFKAYLHLKENDRFYMYLRDGRQLQPEQKQRLEANEISSVFMKVADIDNFRMFLAAAYLKETIRASSQTEAA